MRFAPGAKRRPLKWLRSERGTAVVEFAIVAPVFIFLLVGLIEVGRYAYFATLAASAARAGVQYGAQNTITAADTVGIQAAAAAGGQGLPAGFSSLPNHLCLLGNSNGTVSTTSCPTTGLPQSNWIYFVQVQTTGTVTPMLNYPGIPKNFTVGSTAIMRVVNQ